mmetsp:Transcript_32893/g.29184  ORF Transcript_32893/g.29184 Transcript_32893/m.29184 type:complete len:99 (+) Transcript_32893:254-550(+)
MEDEVKKRLNNDRRFINKEGEFIITSGKYRTQEQNQADAYSKMENIINQFSLPPKIRKKFEFKESSGEKFRREDRKRKTSQIKRMRGSSGGAPGRRDH